MSVWRWVRVYLAWWTLAFYRSVLAPLPPCSLLNTADRGHTVLGWEESSQTVNGEWAQVRQWRENTGWIITNKCVTWQTLVIEGQPLTCLTYNVELIRCLLIYIPLVRDCEIPAEPSVTLHCDTCHQEDCKWHEYSEWQLTVSSSDQIHERESKEPFPLVLRLGFSVIWGGGALCL